MEASLLSSPHQALSRLSQAVWDVSFHECGDFLVSGSMDHTARLYDINSERCRQVFRGHADSINCVTFQPFTNTVCTASADKSISLWDMRSGLNVQTFRQENNAVNTAMFNARGDMLVSGDADGSLKLWDLRTVNELREIKTGDQRHPVNDARFDRSGQVIVVASASGLIKVFDVGGKQLADLGGHEDSVHAVTFASNDSMLVSAGTDATFRLWSA